MRPTGLVLVLADHKHWPDTPHAGLTEGETAAGRRAHPI
jgi:hypothetical protein